MVEQNIVKNRPYFRHLTQNTGLWNEGTGSHQNKKGLIRTAVLSLLGSQIKIKCTPDVPLAALQVCFDLCAYSYDTDCVRLHFMTSLIKRRQNKLLFQCCVVWFILQIFFF